MTPAGRRRPEDQNHGQQTGDESPGGETSEITDTHITQNLFYDTGIVSNRNIGPMAKLLRRGLLSNGRTGTTFRSAHWSISLWTERRSA